VIRVLEGDGGHRLQGHPDHDPRSCERESILSKANLGELFFNERRLRLPPMFRHWSAISISERVLRNLITVLIILFILTLGTALALQLVVDRSTHIAKHNEQSLLFFKLGVFELNHRFETEAGQGATMRLPVTADLEWALPNEAGKAGRQFAIVDDNGIVRASFPEGSLPAGKSLL
jgi:hypothetical protein